MDVGLGASKPAIVSFSTSAAKNGILKRNICQLSQREAVNRQLLTIALFRCYSALRRRKKGVSTGTTPSALHLAFKAIKG